MKIKIISENKVRIAPLQEEDEMANPELAELFAKLEALLNPENGTMIEDIKKASELFIAIKEASGVLGTDIAMSSPGWNVDEGNSELSGEVPAAPPGVKIKSKKQGWIEQSERSSKPYPSGRTTMNPAELTKNIKELPGVNRKDPQIYMDPDTGGFWALVNFSTF
jgi:hypothetical protein